LLQFFMQNHRNRGGFEMESLCALGVKIIVVEVLAQRKAERFTLSSAEDLKWRL
jgi:hypothetical protein